MPRVSKQDFVFAPYPFENQWHSFSKAFKHGKSYQFLHQLSSQLLRWLFLKDYPGWSVLFMFSCELQNILKQKVAFDHLVIPCNFWTLNTASVLLIWNCQDVQEQSTRRMIVNESPLLGQFPCQGNFRFIKKIKRVSLNWKLYIIF